jgi:hypothetical protein
VTEQFLQQHLGAAVFANAEHNARFGEGCTQMIDPTSIDEVFESLLLAHCR